MYRRHHWYVGDCVVETSEEEESMCHHTLLLPGRNLYLTPLLEKKKFRGKGNKEGALLAFRTLQEDHIGDIHTVPNSKVRAYTLYMYTGHRHVFAYCECILS